MGVLDDDVDGLAGWVARRERRQRAATVTWAALLVVSGLLVLLSDAYLAAPVVPLSLAAVWLGREWAADRWWGARAARAGHPVVRADLAWSTATGGPLPQGWSDAAIPGALHRTASGWIWRPSSWVNARLRVLRWTDDEVAAPVVRPLPSPGAPPCAQLRLYLRDGGHVDLLVRRPSRLGLAPSGLDQLR